MCSSDLALALHPSVPATTIPQLVAHAKANPGKLSFASAGVGTSAHLAGEMFKQMAGVNVVHVPYKGGGPALNDLLAGQVAYMFGGISGLAPHAQTGKVRILGVTGSVRSQVASNVPTVAEAGFPGYAADAWTGFFSPAALPAAIVKRWNTEVNRTIETPEVKAMFLKGGNEPRAMTVDQFKKQVIDDNRKWGQIIKNGNIKVE